MPDGAASATRKVFRGLFGLILPDDCRLCGEPLREISRVPVCSECLQSVEPLQAEYACASCRTPFVNRAPLDESGQCALCRLGLTNFDNVYTYGSYEGSLRKLIHLYKYEGIQPLANHLAKLLARAIPREQSFDVVIPMPLHWRKRWARGYNQSEFLAREIARVWNIPMQRALRRVKATVPQAGLTNSKRRLNVRGAFAVKRNTRLDGKRVLLIDDVFTTGSTASACAAVLKRAGTRHVAIAAVARTDRRLFFEASENFAETAPLAEAARSGNA